MTGGAQRPSCAHCSHLHRRAAHRTQTPEPPRGSLVRSDRSRVDRRAPGQARMPADRLELPTAARRPLAQTPPAACAGRPCRAGHLEGPSAPTAAPGRNRVPAGHNRAVGDGRAPQRSQGAPCEAQAGARAAAIAWSNESASPSAHASSNVSARKAFLVVATMRSWAARSVGRRGACMVARRVAAAPRSRAACRGLPSAHATSAIDSTSSMAP